MKIHWNQNPFRTTIVLDESDRERIVLFIQSEEYSDILCELDLWLQGKIRTEIEVTLDEVHKEISAWGAICNMKTDDPRVNSIEEDLQHSHGGDCVCWPMTCMRCVAEGAIGVNTLEGLGKHSAHKIMSAFGKDGDRTIDEAIEILNQTPSYQRPDNWPHGMSYEKHVPRWESERQAALKWLKEYKETHRF